ncbi:thioredoxin fold domain-containing protein [Paucibacter sp. APW11]|uniref:Thioredoxin fold domain-containing protein n=1 Tax=Roseateles aquae TaxID=3077235 RepID=A0ABU3PGJ8_9BURK|nr:thioredoxin fold domain-containing protein [Paucibacter sp. APW11]MDT9001623.1 thioredoxin fold domain-containing protein [Paucibacter sp. APW11]
MTPSSTLRGLRLSSLASASLISLALLAPLQQAHATAPVASVSWQEAAGDSDVEKAFAQARSEKKPVLLYWGAKWCPPCNQLKATLFNRQDFIEQSRAFVAVHIDGDLPGAQKLGTRFKVRGYPTMILFSPEGQELTRLPGEADAPQVLKVLQLGLAGGRPIKNVLADARAGKKLSANEWKLLGFYSWDTDEQQLVPAAERPGLLAQLAAASQGADAETGTRLWLKALAANADGKSLKVDAALQTRVRALLGNAADARAQVDSLNYGASDIVRSLAPTAGAERNALIALYETALKRFEADATLSRADRLSALVARVDLARVDQPKDSTQPKLNAALLKEVKDTSVRLDKEITDGYERQAVITQVAYLLGHAGQWKDSDELLKASLSKSHSPYYLMSQLGGNAKKQGRKDEALKWYEEAFNKSEGPATRLQWGSGYFGALVELAPQDSAKIEKIAAQLFNEAAQDKGSFYERSARSLQKVGSSLAKWNDKGQHDAVLARLKTQLDGICAKVDTADKQRETCESLVKAPAKKA